ncbi:YlxR family protein [Arthrobacter sp. H14-L1]|uniref:YlxR family protein n=1 Tax=Arthrobacter sp. H14-L1 TaxID=2996697 RepID=UPI00226E1A14|nr:YlxR family protein [Arthrobacter sp. H14-L1]MCY0904682.1 YlxR family protein [Arthrobacter sp. H14-L1]
MVREKSADGVIAAVADPRRRLWGRGAWLHPCLQCLALALKRRAIGRALPGVVDCSSVQSHIRALGSAEVVVGEQ